MTQNKESLYQGSVFITAETIKDLSDIKGRYASLMFYLWVALRYENEPFSINEAVIGYDRTRRNIFRYLRQLRQMDMIEKVFNGKKGFPALYRIVEV